MRGIRAAVAFLLFLPMLVVQPGGSGLGVWSRIAGGAAPAQAEPKVSVTFAGGKLSVRAGGAPLAEIIAEIERATGIPILIDPALADELAREATRVELSNVPIEDALRRLLGTRHLVVLYTPSGVDEVRVYPQPGAGHATASGARPAHPPRDQVRAAKKAQPGGAGGPDRAEKARRRAAAEARLAEGPAGGSGSQAGETPIGTAEAARALEQSGDARAHERALDALLGTEGSVPLEPVLRFAESTRDPELKGQALEVLAAHGATNPRVLRLLRALATGDPDEDVRDRAQSLLKEAAR